MSSVQGYGINSDNIDWCLDINQILYYGIKNSNAIYLNEELSQCESKYADEEFDEMFDAFCDEYENPMYMWYGFNGVVTDYIDAVAFDGRELFRYEDYCFYVDAADALSARLTTDEIEERLMEFFQPLCKNPIRVDWYDIHFD